MALIDNFKDEYGLWARYNVVNKVIDSTRSGQVWTSMTSRCKVGGSEQKRNPTYIGCTMSENFKDFQFFANWHMRQVGFGVEGFGIDKDLLFSGNKLYSEDTCVLIPKALNAFLTLRTLDRGDYPLGVFFSAGKFSSGVSIGGKRVHLGSYKTVEEAKNAYKIAKENEARRWYKRLCDKEFIVDEKVIERMRVWTMEE